MYAKKTAPKKPFYGKKIDAELRARYRAYAAASRKLNA